MIRVAPESRTSLMRLIMRRRTGGSMPLVGSSRMSSFGPATTAWASLVICRMPSE